MNVEGLSSLIQKREIKIVLQPIVSLRDGTVHGYEALTRVADAGFGIDTSRLFSLAEETNLLWYLEYIAREMALEKASECIFSGNEKNKKLFLNVSPVIMQDSRFKKGFTKILLEKFSIKESNIVIEITERNTTTDMNSFKEIVNHYKEQGFNIAVDDMGSGYSGLNLISEISPKYVKVDMNLIRNIHRDRLKQGIVRGIIEFSSVSNIALIAEGIETREELETLTNLGIQYGQGYYIQRPHEDVLPIRKDFLRMLADINARKNNLSNRALSDIYIQNICMRIDTAAPADKIKDLYAIHANNPEFIGLCVLNDGAPIGIVTRETLFRALGGAFGFSLNCGKSITEIMDKDFLAVDAKKSIDMVSALAMGRPTDKLYDFVVVVNGGGGYVGIVTVKNLLLKTTEIEVATARHQNPLSGLPGNFIIEQRMTDVIAAKTPYSVAYIDIDNFKAYNDAYGFESGDCVLKLFADKMKELVSENCFVGHVGGDDFVAIIGAHVTEAFFADILERFRAEVRYFYSRTDLKNGYITACGRNDTVTLFPLLDATCVVVDNKHTTFESPSELSEQLAVLKKTEKMRKSAIFSLCRLEERQESPLAV